MEDRAQKNVDGYSHIEHEEVTLIRMGKEVIYKIDKGGKCIYSDDIDML